jgi:hypothetical protein
LDEVRAAGIGDVRAVRGRGVGSSSISAGLIFWHHRKSVFDFVIPIFLCRLIYGKPKPSKPIKFHPVTKSEPVELTILEQLT